MKIVFLIALALVAVYAAPEVSNKKDETSKTNDEEVGMDVFIQHLMDAHNHEGTVDEFIQQLINEDEMASEQDNDKDDLENAFVHKEDDDDDIQALLAHAQNADEEKAIIQELIAHEQDPGQAKTQWLRKIFRKGGRIIRRIRRWRSVRRIGGIIRKMPALPSVNQPTGGRNSCQCTHSNPYIRHGHNAYKAYKCYRG